MPVAGGHVVDDGVAPDMLHRVFGRDALAALADDDGQFDLVVDCIGYTDGDFDGVRWPNHGLRHFGKIDRHRGDGAGGGAAVKAAASELLGVGEVVLADTKNIAAWLGQGGADVQVAQGQRCQGFGQFCTASQGFNDGQCAQLPHIRRQIERRDGFQIA